VIAAGGVAQETTVTETTTVETTTESPTVTEQATITQATTVERTTTRRVVVPATTASTTTGACSESSTPTWVWVLLGVLAIGLVVAIFLLASRRGGGAAPEGPTPELRRRLDAAVGSWLGQGWAIESQSADSAVLRREGERMLVSVDAAGQVTTRPLAGEWPGR
jgi:hypothetical protein